MEQIITKMGDDEVVLSIPPPSFPSTDEPHSSEMRSNFLKYGLPLYKAALEGDWETAESIFDHDPYWLKASITKRKDTALHIAAAAKQTGFVKKLVERMVGAGDNLELINNVANTAFCFAASCGTVEIAKAMVDKNHNLPNIRGSQGLTPLHMAILLGHRDMVWYIYRVTDHEQLTQNDRIDMLIHAIEADLFDVALQFLNEHPHLALCRNANGETIMHALAQKPLGNYESRQSIWKNFTRQCCKASHHKEEEQLTAALKLVNKAWNEVIKMEEDVISNVLGKPWRLLFVAAELGNFEFLNAVIRSYPDVIWKIDERNQTIFHVAIRNRHVKIFNLIHEIGAIKDLLAAYKDNYGNNMLHLAAMLAPSHSLNSVSGAALQMQQELLWFKVVEDVVRPQYAVDENRCGKTPQEVFSEQHKGLREEGEAWMKKTAESCTLVATLIATVDFQSAFTLPGGNNNENGSPILVKKTWFMVFAISNAVSLFASSSSILMFLSILTSRYAEKDFLRPLPFKLVVGLTSMFISIATMMTAFTATFFITFRDGVHWIPVPITLLATLPVLLFAFQQYPLLLDIYSSIYRSKALFQPTGERRLSWKKGIKKNSGG